MEQFPYSHSIPGTTPAIVSRQLHIRSCLMSFSSFLMQFGMRKQLRPGCHQPTHCMPGFGYLGSVAPFVSHTHLPALVSSAWPGSSHPLDGATAPISQADVGSSTPVCWLVALEPLGLQLSSDPASPGFSLSSLGKSKYSTGSCGCSMLCILLTLISVCLCLVWCPALPGCYFAYSGRSEEGSRARCSAGIDQHRCVHIAEMFQQSYNILKMLPLSSAHVGDGSIAVPCCSQSVLLAFLNSISMSHTLLLLFGCACLYSSRIFFNKTCLSQTFI